MTLKSLKKKLEAIPALQVSERGTGNAKFLYVRSHERALEVSIENGKFFIEYWNVANEESEEDAVNKQTVESESDALARIRDWLEPGKE